MIMTSFCFSFRRVSAADMQWKFPQDNLAVDNYNMMPLGPSPYNPFWSGMQPGMEYAAPYGGSLPYMGYGLGPYDVPFGVLPQDPFGAQCFMMPPVPLHRFAQVLCIFALFSRCLHVIDIHSYIS